MPLPLILAPLLGKLAENGLNMLAGAITAKGKDVIEEKLGVNIEQAVETEEGRVKLRQLEIDHEEFLIEAKQKEAETRLEESKLEVQNTANAQNMNLGIQQSQYAAHIAKVGPYYLDFLVVGATLVLATILLFNGVPPANKELVYMAFGSLVTMCGTILNFHRGSSSGSKASADVMRELAKK